MKNNTLYFLILSIFIGGTVSLKAQKLLHALDKEYDNKPQYEIATFKATRISIGQSIENRKKGNLQLMFMNRSWNLPNQQTQSFVADRWGTRFGVDYAFTDKLTSGIGWSSFEDKYNGYLKYTLARQRKKNNKYFASMAFYQNITYTGDRTVNILDDTFTKRLAFTSQLLIARKFTPNFSLQIAPTFIHNTSSALGEDPKNYFAFGIGGRYKIAKHVSLVSEYYSVANPLTSGKTYNAVALGINWDVRFLMLQFQMTNTRSMVEDGFILQTPNNFNTQDGNFVFGFNAIFNIDLKKNKI